MRFSVCCSSGTTTSLQLTYEITNNEISCAKATNNHATRTRSLRSRSRIDWAVKARVRVALYDPLAIAQISIDR